MKKVYFNARIKATVSFVESLSNIEYTIILHFTVRTSFTTLTMLTCTYMIILTGAFMMNTSYKQIVVETGWVYAFKYLIARNREVKLPQQIDATKMGGNKSSK